MVKIAPMPSPSTTMEVTPVNPATASPEAEGAPAARRLAESIRLAIRDAYEPPGQDVFRADKPGNPQRVGGGRLDLVGNLEGRENLLGPVFAQRAGAPSPRSASAVGLGRPVRTQS